MNNNGLALLILAVIGCFHIIFRLAEACHGFGVNTKFLSANDASEQAKSIAATREVLGGSVVLQPFETGSTGREITSTNQLRCNFGGSCRWRADPLNSFGNFSVIAGKPEPGKLLASTGTTDLPDEPFLIVGTTSAHPAEETVKLISDPIACQLDDGQLSFKYWTSPGVQIKACARKTQSHVAQFCSSIISIGDPGPANVKIPGPIRLPFEIVLEASNFVYNDGVNKGGFVLLDDILYSAQPCSNSNGSRRSFESSEVHLHRNSSASSAATELLLPNSVSACATLNWMSCAGALVARRSVWKLGRGQVGNRLTGVFGPRPGSLDQNYAYVSGQPGLASNRIQVLALSPVDLSETSILEFYYYKASAGADFKVCLNEVSNEACAFVSPAVSKFSRKWEKDAVKLGPGKAITVLFVAENLRPNQFIAVDDLSLYTNGKRPC